MKKLLLTLTIISLSLYAFSQSPRLVLYEEFSGENCGPCAAANPTLWTLCQANTSKTILLKYQSPIPSAGPIYNQNTVDVSNRTTYYTVPFAPYGRMDGKVLGTSNAGHVSYFTQVALDAQYLLQSSFAINVNHSWSADGDSVYATVNVTCSQAFAPAGANLKLRAALVESLHFNSPPGSNGEKDFHNVMRKMYPDGNGISISNSWLLGQVQNYTISGPVPSYVDKTGTVFMIVWIQNDTDKLIEQSAKSTPILLALDAAADSSYVPSKLVCTATNTNVAHTVVLKNTGTTNLTSATIYHKLDAGTFSNYSWSGSLAANATTNILLPAASLTPGFHYFTDSIAMPNATLDINNANDVSYSNVVVHNTTPNSLPIATSFENAGSMPANWNLVDPNSNGQSFKLAYSTSGNIGYYNTKYTLYHNNYNYPAGEANYAILPTPNLSSASKVLNFWVAYATYASENDRLDVVYSTDCGATWTSVWNKQNSTGLSTAPATTSSFVPTQAQWRYESVDLASVPNGALVAFKATSDFGNNLFIDEINLNSFPLSNTELDFVKPNVYPNPSKGNIWVEMPVNNLDEMNITLVDYTGKVLHNESVNSNGNFIKHSINTSQFANGIYQLIIKYNGKTHNQKIQILN